MWNPHPVRNCGEERILSAVAVKTLPFVDCPTGLRRAAPFCYLTCITYISILRTLSTLSFLLYLQVVLRSVLHFHCRAIYHVTKFSRRTNCFSTAWQAQMKGAEEGPYLSEIYWGQNPRQSSCSRICVKYLSRLDTNTCCEASKWNFLIKHFVSFSAGERTFFFPCTLKED
jgi:hypothetical protein